MTDADSDGLKDTDQYGCDLALGIVDLEPETNQTSDPDQDDDGDGILNRNDVCPGTEPDGLTNQEGCSSQQLIDLSDASDGEKDNTGSNTMLIVMIVAGILTGGAFIILKRLESSAIESKNLASIEPQEIMTEQTIQTPIEQTWSAPILDGTADSEITETELSLSSDDIAKFPGWSEEIILRYLDNGWSIEQLAEYYQEQMDENQ